RQLADDFLDGLAEVSRMDAKMAAVRVRLASGYSGAAQAIAPPAVSPQEHTALEMA
ncbi:MAG TPA: endonuclease, partial [Arthrobacter bacterium]|nr:endonuclease [Arthrobacter sp.]